MHTHSQAFSQELHSEWLAVRIWLIGRAKELGFLDLKITDTDVSHAIPKLDAWIDAGLHGQMDYMRRHRDLRANPSELHAGAVRTICLTMPYLALDPRNSEESLNHRLVREQEQLLQADQAVISLYGRGRDYHKTLRNRLQILATELEEKISQLAQANHWGDLHFRVFTDSAPLMEVELATKAGLGWRGKHTLLLNRQSGSFFFLGEILINVPLPLDEQSESHCGSCQACMEMCPTQAITAPYQLDARRCISYLTIEHHDGIPVEFRKAIGNRVYGCDDCQLVCPWNKYAQISPLPDFAERNQLGSTSLLELWSWSETQFNERHEGSAIRRIGYWRWRRNLSIALGNALAAQLPSDTKYQIKAQLQHALIDVDAILAEHIEWALAQDR